MLRVRIPLHYGYLQKYAGQFGTWHGQCLLDSMKNATLTEGTRMKITPEHRGQIKQAMLARIEAVKQRSGLTLSDHVETYTTRHIGKVPMTRLAHDIFNSATMEDGRRSSDWTCDEIYPYANDDHLHTVVARVFADLIEEAA